MNEPAAEPDGPSATPSTAPSTAERGAGWWKRTTIRWIAPAATFVLLKLLRASWRLRETGRENFDRVLASGRSPVIALFHGRAFMLLDTLRGRRRDRWISMCSKSLDGDGMARLERWLGFRVVRGSSGRDGLEALVEMIRMMRDEPGLGACLAVDGSRGPRGVVQGGILSLAQRTGGIIVPVALSARPAWVFRKAWDRTLLAKPFARVEMQFGEPLEVPAKLKALEAEQLRRELEARMLALHERADRASGFRDSEPLQARLTISDNPSSSRSTSSSVL